ncbi:TPR-like protein [Byssothecium circinans]|uniref:TPR-like protein n=1 Tax=Byssothecium circinans TaxID=147558 RepID=A0A6A5TYC1_9PLEO|nr:TPR-like protein [Byssothecium circinans]
MSSGSGPFRQWPSRPSSGNKRFLPVSGTFSNGSGPQRPPVSTVPQPYAAHISNVQQPPASFIPPQHLFQQYQDSFPNAQPQQSQVPPTTTAYQEPSTDDFLGVSQIVHEGFIPAPGREDEDEPTFPDNTRLDVGFESSSEEDSEEERILQEVVERNDNEEIDQDYSASDAELEDDPDEILLEEEVDVKESVLKRGKPKDKSTRSGQRGRASTRGRGGFRSIGAAKTRKTGVRGRRKGPRGPCAVADPGPEFKQLQQLANEAFANHDYDAAIHQASQAIQINPEIFSAWNILSEAHAAKGEEPSSLQALMMGGQTKRDKDLWWLIVDRIDNLDSSKFPEYTEGRKAEMCLTCLKAIMSLDQNDYNARSRKLALESHRGKITRCVKLCQKMLRMDGHEHEYDLLKQMAVLGTSSLKQTKFHLHKILQYYEASIAYFVEKEDPTLDWNLLNIYLDLLHKAGDYNYALSRLKTLCRWKQGRKHETYWDKEEDDREFDIEDTPRRITIAEFVRSRTSNTSDYGGSVPMEIRAKMGMFRLRQEPSNLDEAMHHLNMLEPEDESPYSYLQDYPDIFKEVADTLHETGHDQEALYFYEPLLRNRQEQFDLKSFIGLHTCYKNRHDQTNADKVVAMLKDWNVGTLDDLARLAKFFEDIGLPKEARQRAEIVYRNKATWRLRKVNYGGYTAMLEDFRDERKRQRGKGNVRKMRAKKHREKLRVATGVEEDLEADEDATPKERPSLGPADKRPAKGRGFYRRKFRPTAPQPQIFLPVEDETDPVSVDRGVQREAEQDPAQAAPTEPVQQSPSPSPEPMTLEGTDLPVDKIEHKLFRDKLMRLAAANAEELSSKRTQHREIVTSFERLDELSELADDGDEDATSEYLSIARELVEEFSTFDLFYAERRLEFRGYFRRIGGGELWKESALMALAVEANRVEDGGEERPLQEKPDVIEPEFWSVDFDRWANVFGRYSLYLARRDEKERCFSALDVALQSNIMFRTSEYAHKLEICRLACGLAVNDSEQVSAAGRLLLRRYPFSSDIIRIYSAANRLCPINDGYGNGPAHKSFLRFIKTIDYVLLKPEERTWFNFRGDDRSQWMQAVINSGMMDHVKNHDPALFTLFGHILSSGGSYMGALNYYFRAYALTPKDPMINLSIAAAYLQHSMKRQSENRQFQIQQGISFMTQYYELRTKDDVAIQCSEAEFNMGRMWHGLGLTTQALRAYERCIALSERVKQEAADKCRDDAFGVEDFATEAAFAVQTIYTLSGDFQGAKMVTESLLVIE